MVANDTTVAQAAKHLSAHDAAMPALIGRYGLCTIRPHRNYYQELVDSIISQQLSVKAARTILNRLIELFGGKEIPLPEIILTKTVDEMRAAGLSRAKAAYVRDLAQHVLDGKVTFDRFDEMSNDEILKELLPVKGIGEWTVHMFLMFCMGRLDVLATGDLGIKNGIQKLYGLDHAPTPAEITVLAQKGAWHPYETVACWYIWRSLDNVPAL
jgi:DNA-3-methyladenine glycosylase II